MVAYTTLATPEDHHGTEHIGAKLGIPKGARGFPLLFQASAASLHSLLSAGFVAPVSSEERPPNIESEIRGASGDSLPDNQLSRVQLSVRACRLCATIVTPGAYTLLIQVVCAQI